MLIAPLPHRVQQVEIDGKKPFDAWLGKLKDVEAAAGLDSYSLAGREQIWTGSRHQEGGEDLAGIFEVAQRIDVRIWRKCL